MCRDLKDHGHWVNMLALNTDYVMRTGSFDPSKAGRVALNDQESPKVRQEKALKRYQDFMKVISILIILNIVLRLQQQKIKVNTYKFK